jgi:hypothetical protein
MALLPFVAARRPLLDTSVPCCGSCIVSDSRIVKAGLSCIVEDEGGIIMAPFLKFVRRLSAAGPVVRNMISLESYHVLIV